jgi:hypothetical protein
MLIYALALAQAAPTPLTEIHQRDIGCVAVLGIIAYEQNGGKKDALTYPDVRETGKRWAGIVGQRVMDETGQPRELVAFVINQAVAEEQQRSIKAADPGAYASARVGECTKRMDADLAVIDAAEAPLPKPQKSQ